MSDSTYFYILGIVTSAIVVAMVLFVSWVKRTARKVMRFFEPTKIPARPVTSNGPSPASVLLGSIVSVLEFVAVATLAFAAYYFLGA